MSETETASPSKISVSVRLFASYREAAGAARLSTSLPTGARVSDLVEALSSRLPGLHSTRGLIAVNHEYASADAALQDGDEVALIPPVSGGGWG